MISRIHEFIKSSLGHCLLMQKASNHNFLIFDSIEAIGKDDWTNATSTNSIFNSYEYLLSLEKGTASEMSFRYVLICDKEQPIAAAFFQVIDFKNMTLKKLLNADYFPTINSVLEKLSDEFIFGSNKEEHHCLIIGGNLFSTGESCLLVSKDDLRKETEGLFPHILRLVEDSLPDNFKTIGALIKDFETENSFTNQIIKTGFKSFEIDPDMLMQLNKNWKCFDDYADALASKYRVRMRSAKSKAPDLVVKDLSLEEVKNQSKKINLLFDSVFKNAPVRLTSLGADYFINLKQNLGENFIMRAFYYDGEVVAYSTALLNKNKLCAHLVGIDYEKNKSLALYQNILYDYIEDGINRNCRCINFGRDALEIKSTVGAEPISLKLFIRFSNPFANKLAGPFISLSKPKSWIQRKPFRETTIAEAAVA